MGFSEARSKKALVHFRNNFEAAMAYMLNNDEATFKDDVSHNGK
jgi:uncharacterized UBP type Zn finger protein